jgi:uncharacterized membrane protein
MDNNTDRKIDILFKVSLFLKGVDGLIETFGALFFYFINLKTINNLIFKLTSRELSEDPGDRISLWLINLGQSLSLGVKNFAAIYLLLHGLVKVFLVVFLLKKKLWAYPVATVFISIFVIYQLYRLSHHYVLWLLCLTILDLIIIVLINYEYHKIKKINSQSNH